MELGNGAKLYSSHLPPPLVSHSLSTSKTEPVKISLKIGRNHKTQNVFGTTRKTIVRRQSTENTTAKKDKTKTITDAVATAVAQHRCWVQIETQKEMGKSRFSKNDLDSQDPILKTWSKSPHKREREHNMRFNFDSHTQSLFA